MTAEHADYEISLVTGTWYRDDVRYRRVITMDGRTVIEKGVDGRYVPDHVRGRD